MRRDSSAVRSRAVAQPGRRRCSATFCRPCVDRLVRTHCARPAFHFKRERRRARAAGCARSAEIERRTTPPTVWTVCRMRRASRVSGRRRVLSVGPRRSVVDGARHAIAHRSHAASRRGRLPYDPVSTSGHRRAHATLAGCFTRFSTAHRIRPRAARCAPSRTDLPRSPSAHARPDCRPPRHAQLEDTT